MHFAQLTQPCHFPSKGSPPAIAGTTLRCNHHHQHYLWRWWKSLHLCHRRPWAMALNRFDISILEAIQPSRESSQPAIIPISGSVVPAASLCQQQRRGGGRNADQRRASRWRPSQNRSELTTSTPAQCHFFGLRNQSGRRKRRWLKAFVPIKFSFPHAASCDLYGAA